LAPEPIQFSFVNVKGFAFDTAFIRIESDHIHALNLIFYDSNFNFYDRSQRLIRSCHDQEQHFSSSRFLLHFEKPLFLTFKSGVRFLTPVCPHIFRNVSLYQLNIYFLISTFYKKNVLNFLNDNNAESSSSSPLNAQIKNLILSDSYAIDLDSSILNANVFERLEYFEVRFGSIDWIEANVFRSFAQLKFIRFGNLVNVFRRQGIAWIQAINKHLNVDLTDREQVRENSKFAKVIRFDDASQLNFDRDFCVFSEFPFHQLIILDSFYSNKSLHQSEINHCILFWFISNYKKWSTSLSNETRGGRQYCN
jgi:hypothetical protein